MVWLAKSGACVPWGLCLLVGSGVFQLWQRAAFVSVHYLGQNGRVFGKWGHFQHLLFKSFPVVCDTLNLAKWLWRCMSLKLSQNSKVNQRLLALNQKLTPLFEHANHSCATHDHSNTHPHICWCQGMWWKFVVKENLSLRPNYMQKPHAPSFHSLLLKIMLILGASHSQPIVSATHIISMWIVIIMHCHHYDTNWASYGCSGMVLQNYGPYLHGILQCKPCFNT